MINLEMKEFIYSLSKLPNPYVKECILDIGGGK